MFPLFPLNSYQTKEYEIQQFFVPRTGVHDKEAHGGQQVQRVQGR